jgi:transposase InsO family protein
MAGCSAGSKQLIQEAYEKSHQTYGYRRITLWIRKHKGICLNHKTVLRLMHVLQIRSIARRPKLFKRVADLDIYHRYDNVLNRNFTATHPNQKWTTDITYLRSQQGWVYLSVIRDLFDGFIVAYELGRENSLALVLNTLKQAKQNEQVREGLILHSDQGYQYTSQGYHTLIRE